MRARRISKFLGLVVVLPCLVQSARLRAAEEKPSTEPALVSIFPLGGQQGSLVQAEIRGANLEGAYGLWSSTGGLSGEIKNIEPIASESKPSETKKNQQIFRVRVQLNINSRQANGTYSLRLMTPRGISNPVPFEVTQEAMIVESELPHQTPAEAEPVRLPAVVNGRIQKAGELDYYMFEAAPGQELTFKVKVKEEKAAGLGAPPEFQPQLNLYETGGSWLDPQQNNWLGAGSLDTPLTHRFERAGRYLVQMGGILGKGSPDYAYQLRIAPSRQGIAGGEQSPGSSARSELEAIATQPGWQERAFTRRITPAWTEGLRSRTVEASPADTIASTAANIAQTSAQGEATHDRAIARIRNAAPASVTPLKETEPDDKLSQAVTAPIPALVSGTIGQPGDVDTFRFKAAKGQRVAFEIETPDIAPPRFNPQLSILDAEGREIVNNIRKRTYTLRREAPSMTVPAFFDGIQPKVIMTFAAAGDYYVQIRGLTFRTGGSRCAYRVMVRDQVPHIGSASLKEDHVNLPQGEAQALTVSADLEESFDGELALTVENLPQGVRAFPATEAAVKEPDGYETQHKENLDPQSRKVTILLSAEVGSPASIKPSLIRLQGAPVVNGKLGRHFTIAEIPLMVVRPLQTKPSGLVAGTRVP